MKRFFVLTLGLFVMLWVVFAYTAEAEDPKVVQLNQQIEKLEDMKRGYESRALRHENQAERLQFDDQAVLETRRHNQLADENREKADLVQQEIDRLKAEKATLLKKNR